MNENAKKQNHSLSECATKMNLTQCQSRL